MTPRQASRYQKRLAHKKEQFEASLEVLNLRKNKWNADDADVTDLHRFFATNYANFHEYFIRCNQLDEASLWKNFAID